MTVINITGRETLNGTPGAIDKGDITAEYWAGDEAHLEVDGAEIVFPRPIRVEISGGEPRFVVDLPPTDGSSCVKWTISSKFSARELVRYTSIPASGPVDFGDLPDVDPASFAPVDATPTLIETIDERIALGGGGGGGAVDSVAGKVGVVTLVKGDVGLGNVDNTSDAAKPVSTAQATALAGKASTSHAHVEADVTGLTAALAGKAATSHAHVEGDVSGLTAALAAKAPLASPAFTGTPTGITKTHVGLANVDNTSDASKPVSTAQAAADALKANIASPTFTGTVSGITKTMVGLSSVDNTADTAKPVSTAQATAIALKLDTSAAPELIRDTIATALVAGTNVTITPNDGADTITIAASGGGGGGDVTGSVSLIVAINTETTFAASDFLNVPFQQVVENIGGGAYNTSTGVFTVPSSGLYLLEAEVKIKTNEAQRPTCLQFYDGSNEYSTWMALPPDNSARGHIFKSVVARLTSGMSLRARLYSQGSTFLTDSGGDSRMSVTKLSD